MMKSPPDTLRPPRPSATLVVVRDGEQGLEALLMQRAERGDLNSGAWVFPGGLVDAGDRACHGLCLGLDDAIASARLGLDRGGLDYYVAAVRECFEESGLLFAADARGDLVAADALAGVDLLHWRNALHRGEQPMGALCDAIGLRLATERLVYLSHWLTPVGRAKRFDTRFFLARAPLGQDSDHDTHETVAHRWLTPVDALAGDTYKLMTPTRKTLELLARFRTAQEALDWAAAPRAVALVMPRVGVGEQGQRPVLPDEAAWAEIGRLDPQGHGHVCYDIQPGVPVRLSDRVWRVTANNGSMMTGPGTNTYLVGGGSRNEWAVIDPGPADDEHVTRIVQAAPGEIRWIIVTHTHKDHSPGAQALKARTGAPLLGRVALHPQWQDADFRPDRILAHGERLPLGEDTTLRVIHTPGHASNHLCYLLEQEKTLFTGDHIMQSSTVVINPPDGDMAAYLASLQALLDEELDWLAPGHGFLMASPRQAIEGVIAHRRRREARVVAALHALGPATAGALLERVYDDVPPRLHAVAARSLDAHLQMLAAQGTALFERGHWRLAV